MARGKELALTEQTAILELRKTGMTLRAISVQLKRSLAAVQRVTTRGHAEVAKKEAEDRPKSTNVPSDESYVPLDRQLAQHQK